MHLHVVEIFASPQLPCNTTLWNLKIRNNRRTFIVVIHPIEGSVCVPHSWASNSFGSTIIRQPFLTWSCMVDYAESILNTLSVDYTKIRTDEWWRRRSTWSIVGNPSIWHCWRWTAVQDGTSDWAQLCSCLTWSSRPPNLSFTCTVPCKV